MKQRIWKEREKSKGLWDMTHDHVVLSSRLICHWMSQNIIKLKDCESVQSNLDISTCDWPLAAIRGETKLKVSSYQFNLAEGQGKINTRPGSCPLCIDSLWYIPWSRPCIYVASDTFLEEYSGLHNHSYHFWFISNVTVKLLVEV